MSAALAADAREIGRFVRHVWPRLCADLSALVAITLFVGALVAAAALATGAA